MSHDPHNERVEQIRQRLEAATPGPWETHDNMGDHSVYDSQGGCIAMSSAVYPEGFFGLDCDDASLIAHAPEDLRYLLDQLHHATQEVAAARQQVGEKWRNWMQGDDLPKYHRELELWDGGSKRAFGYFDEDDHEQFWILSHNGQEELLENFGFWRYASRPDALTAAPTGTPQEGGVGE